MGLYPKATYSLQHQLQNWFRQPLGQRLLSIERDYLNRILPQFFGYYILQLGSLGQEDNLLDPSLTLEHIVLDSSLEQQRDIIADMNQLPIATEGIDVVLLPHSLEFAQQPQQILIEVDRVLIPEGHVIIVGFHPRSLWGLRQCFEDKHEMPWCGHFISVAKLRSWLNSLGFKIESKYWLFFSLPWVERQIIERWGQWIFPYLAGVYVIVAKKQVSTLTPIKPRWYARFQLLSGSSLQEPSTYQSKD